MCVVQNGSVCIWGTNEHGCVGLGPRQDEGGELGATYVRTSDPGPHILKGDALDGATVPSPALRD